mmetsp:Transcript_32800/g.29667  ORF Transcript_32800/g.29667 Transcript_32800/m.29667 type:complete len:97 (+) Transcript_32800:1913-2203(+)|eukprot:CAMPEP_0114576666 /NCGR_PEP_ID=MMETSP0125-20121206/1400_1 /TAXON_ID=485358 ORGANISM="Aristerostoma sp., Strain ATCC 50986" /NCGR_SAMPLE_ID=MMETSP0125 /ASSEMBLY_ACC=CAM_ASM_000245 /LENGTH=96 /DNA_ID=CAMNT_0001765353 /DNA_START=1023 /DNA_END=1313 /DNA_ORIENTATION=+
MFYAASLGMQGQSLGVISEKTLEQSEPTEKVRESKDSQGTNLKEVVEEDDFDPDKEFETEGKEEFEDFLRESLRGSIMVKNKQAQEFMGESQGKDL